MATNIERHARLTLQLAEAEATLDMVGGKGAALARMAAAGLPVPAGFHISTAAYRRFVEENELQAAIVVAAAQSTADDPASQERASTTIRALFEGGMMPDALAQTIGRSYAELDAGEPAVAVRSSATAEDLPEASFAGQQETYLNVRGESALLEAVRRCWASLWTARALAYRARRDVESDEVAMGVVVQRMVPAELSGVLFTANPTSGERDRLMLNASFGLGEAIVAGEVTPDSYVLDKASLELVDVAIGDKATLVAPADAGGTVAREVPPARRAERALSDRLLRDLGELGVRIEALFGGTPQDVEWAVADGKSWILQARPVTNLPRPPLRDVRWEPPVPGSAWTRRQVVENMPEPLSALFEELYLIQGLDRAIDGLLDQMNMSREVYAQVIDRPFFTTVNGYAYLRADVRFSWRNIFQFWNADKIRWLFHNGVPNWRDDSLPEYLATVEQWKQRDPARLSDAELLEGVRTLAWADAAYWWATLRRLALELGGRLTTVGALEEPADIFYLKSTEIRAASAARGAGEAGPNLARLARERRELREARKRLHPSPAVPVDYRYRFGPFDMSLFETQRRNVDRGPVLNGFRVSPGRVTGTASVIRSPADFGRMQPDSILV